MRSIKIKTYTYILLLCLSYTGCTSPQHYHLADHPVTVKTGLEIFLNGAAEKFTNKKILLITNHSGLNSSLMHNIILLKKKGMSITTIFAPEHGISGSQQSYDSRTMLADNTHNVTIYNLHKLKQQQMRFLLKNHDAAVFDIQDMGMRCYTYISNLKNIIDAMKNLQTRLIVLDRPNPIGFLGVHGFMLNKKFKTRFVSTFPAPLFYGLTIGEAALFYNDKTGSRVKLKVISMKGYKRGMMFHETGLPWVPPSPNLPTYESSLIYTITVLMEGINISLGRGTSKPFEYIGAPWINAEKMAADLNAMKIQGFRFRPVYFSPAFSNFTRTQCSGVHIYYTGGNFDPLEVSYKIMSYLLKEYPQIRWVKKDSFYWIDALSGTDIFRKGLLKNKSYNQIKKKMQSDSEQYRKIHRKYWLY